MRKLWCWICLPLLGLVPALEERDGDEDDDSLTSVANLDLRILVSASCAAQCPPPLRSKYGYGYACGASASVRCWWRLILPRGQRRTAEGAESSSGRGHCSRGQSTPVQLLVCGRMSIESGKLALAMLVSISEGLCLEGELGAILFRALADMSAAGEISLSAGQKESSCRPAKTNWKVRLGARSLSEQLGQVLARTPCTCREDGT